MVVRDMGEVQKWCTPSAHPSVVVSLITQDLLGLDNRELMTPMGPSWVMILL